MATNLKTIAGQPSWVIRTGEVELAITELGGHMAPVTFYRRSGRPVQPYYISPWQTERLEIDVPVLVPLRGDFFCAPFGGPSTVAGKTYLAHGDSACLKWHLADLRQDKSSATLELRMDGTAAPGRITKQLTLVEGQQVVYCRHVLDGFSGPMTLAHHATLAMPERQRSVAVTTSPIRFGLTNPTPPGDPAAGSYYCLAVGRRFASLSRVPTLWKDHPLVDCTHFPDRKGYCDQFAVFSKPPWERRSPDRRVAVSGNPRSAKIAWTAATFLDDGFLWFSLKDPAVLPGTMFWAENHGRHGSPWSGRNCCLGMEEICGFLSEGLAASAKPNVLSRAGVPTTVKLSPKRPTAVNYIQGVIRTPRGFDAVRSARFAPGEVEFTSASGKTARAAVNHEFLKTGKIGL